jgi:hypothetical protein
MTARLSGVIDINILILTLQGHFSESVIRHLGNKSQEIINSNSILDGYINHSYLVKDKSEHRPQCVIFYVNLKKSTCTCNYFKKNYICIHTIAIAGKCNKLAGFLTEYCKNKQKTVKKRNNPRYPKQQFKILSQEVNNTSDCDNKKVWVLCELNKRIKKCAGCHRDIKKLPHGVLSELDHQFCLTRFERYSFFNKFTKSMQLTRGNRYYHMLQDCIVGKPCVFKIEIPLCNDKNICNFMKKRFGSSS